MVVVFVPVDTLKLFTVSANGGESSLIKITEPCAGIVTDVLMYCPFIVIYIPVSGTTFAVLSLLYWNNNPTPFCPYVTDVISRDNMRVNNFTLLKPPKAYNPLNCFTS